LEDSAALRNIVTNRRHDRIEIVAGMRVPWISRTRGH
jgi:hypothetical protein